MARGRQDSTRQFDAGMNYQMGILRPNMPPNTPRPEFRSRKVVEVPGDLLVNTYQIRSIRDLIEKGPTVLQLTPGEPYTIYEVDESGQRKYFSGVTIPILSPGGGLADPAAGLPLREAPSTARMRYELEGYRERNNELVKESEQKDDVISQAFRRIDTLCETLTDQVNARIELAEKYAEERAENAFKVAILEKEKEWKAEQDKRFKALEEKAQGLSDGAEWMSLVREAVPHVAPILVERVMKILDRLGGGDAGTPLPESTASPVPPQPGSSAPQTGQVPMGVQRGSMQAGVAGPGSAGPGIAGLWPASRGGGMPAPVSRRSPKPNGASMNGVAVNGSAHSGNAADVEEL